MSDCNQDIPTPANTVYTSDPCDRWKVSHNRPLNVTVLGGGAFGTALAVVAARAGHSVKMYVREDDTVESINSKHVNNKRFTEFVLPPSISATNDFSEAVKYTDLIVHCIPAQSTPQFVKSFADQIPVDVPYVSTAKGIVESKDQLISEALKEALGRPQPLAYLSGPTFAREIMEGHPMALVVASEDMAVAKFVQHALSSRFFRIYATTDVIGVEVGGAIKNPLAIGAGFAAGLGFGQSTLAALITRGCVELKRLAVALGGQSETLSGLAGIGDLMLTSSSTLSRNRTLGFNMAKYNMTLEEALKASGEVVEGVATARCAARLCRKLNIELPLFEAMAAILDGKISPQDALNAIMTRPLGVEDRDGFKA